MWEIKSEIENKNSTNSKQIRDLLLDVFHEIAGNRAFYSSKRALHLFFGIFHVTVFEKLKILKHSEKLG